MSEWRLSIDEGKFLVRLARRSVSEYLLTLNRIEPPPDTPPRLMEKRGVFVTIEELVQGVDGVIRHSLRGCIGFPDPVYPLAKATIEAAIAAATEDPRFPPMTSRELKNVIFEVSVLTPRRELKYEDPEELPKMIKVGRDGLYIEKGWLRGLLLPQVPVEYGWDEEEFLSQACVKARLPPTAWREGNVKVYVFQAQIFAEVFPEGDIIERVLLLEGD